MQRRKAVYIGIWLYPFVCSRCSQYTLLFNDNKLDVDSEKIKVNNFYLHFSPTKKAGIIWQVVDGKERPIRRVKLEELTPEIAMQWVDKLRKYVIFQ